MRQQWCVYCLPIQLSIIMELEGSFWFLSVERERKKKNLNSHSCNLNLQLRDIYIQG